MLVLIVRGKPLKRLVHAVEGAGGEVRAYPAPKPWELPKWVVERAAELGLQLDGDAAKALVGLVGSSQQQLSRELEKIAARAAPRKHATVADVAAAGGRRHRAQVYDLADALVAGELVRHPAAGRGARGPRRAPRPADVPDRAPPARGPHAPPACSSRGCRSSRSWRRSRLPPWLAKKTIARAKKADRAALERALCVFAELEIELRGGGDAALDEDTAFSLALAAATG